MNEKPAQPKKNMNVRLPVEVFDSLNALAEHFGQTKTDLICEMIMKRVRLCEQLSEFERIKAGGSKP